MQAATYSHLRRCSSVWHCPVDTAVIAERRRGELETAIATWRSRGNTCAIAAFTFRHGAGDVLADVLDRFLAAVRALPARRGYKKLKADVGLAHTIRALEVTWGAENGWHPHSHILQFLEGPKSDPGALQAKIYPEWQAAAAGVGLDMDAEHGLKIQDTDQAVADYVAKFGHLPTRRIWQAEDELTKAMSKKAHGRRGVGDRYTPWDLLRWLQRTGEVDPIRLWVEYAHAFKGRSQLQWSRDLRKALAIEDEQTDREICLEAREDAIVLAQLEPEDWAQIRRRGLRGELLEAARAGDPEQLEQWIAGAIAGGAE